MSEIQLKFPISKIAYFVFSYMGHTHIYKKIDLKKELTKIILSKGGKELTSYTDSSIIFQATFGKKTFDDLNAALSKLCNDFSPKIFFSLVMSHHTTGDTNYIVWSGDKELNEHYQTVVKLAQSELKLKKT